MRRDVIVIGASAGGVEALRTVAAGLPPDFEAVILVTMHINAHARSVLPELLEMAGPLRASHARDGQALRRGHIFVAPPDHHMIVVDGVVSLSRGARENGSRPAIDPMFRSAARFYGPRVVGVVLSGTLDDGSAGLAVIKARGGTTIAQSPASALFPDMPRTAIQSGAVDHVRELGDIGPELINLLGPRRGESGQALGAETAPAQGQGPGVTTETALRPGGASGALLPETYACPDCGGVLQIVPGPNGSHYFRCMVGHAWGEHSLLDAQLQSIEESLWAALRALEEHRKLTMRLLADARSTGSLMSTRYEEKLRDIEINAGRIRTLLLQPVQGDDAAEQAADEGDSEAVK